MQIHGENLLLKQLMTFQFGSWLTTLASFQKFEVEQISGCNSPRNWPAQEFNTSVNNLVLLVNIWLHAFLTSIFHLYLQSRYYLYLCRYLSFNNFKGEIPKELANLPELRYLYLHENRFSGRIPPELGSLANLRHL